MDIDASVKLVHLAPDPGHLVREVDLVAEEFAGRGGGAEGVHGGGDDGGGGLLVVEDAEGAAGEDDDEDGD